MKNITENPQLVLTDKSGNKITLTWFSGSDIHAFIPYFQVYGVCYTDDKKILLIKEKGKWKIPGGTPEKHETWQETVKREVFEEATVTINELDLVGAQKVEYPHNPNVKQGELFYQLRCIAKIENILDPQIDPATGLMIEREFVSQQEVLERIGWGEVEKQCLRTVLGVFPRLEYQKFAKDTDVGCTGYYQGKNALGREYFRGVEEDCMEVVTNLLT